VSGIPDKDQIWIEVLATVLVIGLWIGIVMLVGYIFTK